MKHESITWLKQEDQSDQIFNLDFRLSQKYNYKDSLICHSSSRPLWFTQTQKFGCFKNCKVLAIWSSKLYKNRRLFLAILQKLATYGWQQKTVDITFFAKIAKACFYKKILGKIGSSKKSQKQPRWFHWFQRGYFCDFFGWTDFPSTFLKKTNFNIRCLNFTEYHCLKVWSHRRLRRRFQRLLYRKNWVKGQ